LGKVILGRALFYYVRIIRVGFERQHVPIPPNQSSSDERIETDVCAHIVKAATRFQVTGQSLIHALFGATQQITGLPLRKDLEPQTLSRAHIDLDPDTVFRWHNGFRNPM
jgi:hypothetical protein